MGRFEQGISVTDLKALEDFLLDSINHYIDELQGKLGLVELVSYRSSQNAPALAEAVDFYLHSYSYDLDAPVLTEILDGSIILDKTGMLGLLDWLIALSGSMNKPADPVRSRQAAFQRAIDQMQNSAYFDAEAFTFFKELHFPALGWRNTVAASDFDWYYWEDSF
jgi:hypothetical protein